MRKIVFLFYAGLLMASCGSSGKKEESQIVPASISDTMRTATCVFFTPDENNKPVISWCEQDTSKKTRYFFLAYYDENKNSFSSPVNIPVEQNVALHEEGMPKIAVKKNGTIIAAYEVAASTPENEWASYVHYVVSADKGKTWTAPKCIHADTTAGKSRSFADLARLNTGEVAAVWLDETFNYRKGGRPVKFSCTNSENNFQSETVIDSLACECCRTDICAAPGGKIAVIYRDIIGDNIRDMSAAFSTDNGKTFSYPERLSYDNWNINGCPHNGPNVVSNDSNQFAFAWFTGASRSGIYFAGMKNEKQFSTQQLISKDAHHVQLASVNNKFYAVYDEAQQKDSISYSAIIMRALDSNASTTKISRPNVKTSYPVVFSIKNRMIIAWEQEMKGRKRIYYTTVSTPVLQ